MLISNFNLYKNEWLELVFAKRNQEYGAFYIRKHYADNLAKALGVTLLLAVGSSFLVGNLIAAKPTTDVIVPFTNDPDFFVPPPPPEPPKVEPPKPVETSAPAAQPTVELTKTVAFPPPIVAENVVENDIPKIDDQSAVGQVTITNGKAGSNADGATTDKTGTGLGEGVGGTGNDAFLTVEKMPEPVYGMDGWTKFLQSTIRYPGPALENGISGKVFVSFIIEKDGQLSNIKVERGQGYGLDEEAVRVLKKAKAWKPGIQNGHPVRVKLTLPIAFSLGEN